MIYCDNNLLIKLALIIYLEDEEAIFWSSVMGFDGYCISLPGVLISFDDRAMIIKSKRSLI